MDDTSLTGIILAAIGLITAITAYIKSRTVDKKVENIIIQKKIDEVKNGNKSNSET